MSVCIVGWGHTAFGKRTDADTEALTLEAARAALDDAGIDPADVDEIVVGSTGRLGEQAFPSSLPLQMDDAMRFTPSTNVENACATGSAAIHQGMSAIRSGRARFVLIVGVEKMTGASREEVAGNLLKASYVKEESHIRGGFAGVFGLIAESYFQRHGDKSDALAAIAAKNHRNGAKNPLAHFQKDLGYDFCRHASEKNPQVAGPLKRTDCSPVSDGAAALVLTDVETALAMKKAVIFRAATHVNDFLPMSKRDVVLMEGCGEAWSRALEGAGLSLDDLDFVETHDCFTVAEMLEYEAMGLARRGEGADAILDGVTEPGGRLPVNPSGGLKSKGHPIGATGVSMHVMGAMQVTGSAGDIQVPGATLAGIFNMGGVAVANYCSILEPIR